MTAIHHISELAAAVMPDVITDYATQQPGADPVTWSVSTRDVTAHAATPRAVWVPWRDDFAAAQKRPVGGASAQHSLVTRVAGVRVVLWAGSVDATEDLVECLVRRLARVVGVGAPGLTVQSGAWVDETGMLTAGEGYSLFFTVPVDIRAQASAPPARPAVTPTLDTSGAGTPGDGTLDSTEL